MPRDDVVRLKRTDALTRGYSALEIKSFDDATGEITGIATTPSTDRTGDIVDPKGAVFKLPIPLLWQHSPNQPIGNVVEAKVTDAGIQIKAQIAIGLLPEIDRAFALIKGGLVRGLSIGFRGLDDGVEPVNPKDPFGGLKFTKWEWLELSAVTIPANMQASISSIKSACGAASGNAVVRLHSLPGASGSTDPKGNEMKTYTEQIASWEAKRQASLTARKSIMDKTVEEERTLTDEEKVEHDRLGVEVKEIGDTVSRLQAAELEMKTTAAPVIVDPTQTVSSRGAIQYAKDKPLEPGMELARYIKVRMLAERERVDPSKLMKRMYPDAVRLQNIIEVEQNYGATVAKANVLAGTTTDATWAGGLVQYQDIVGTFLDWLRPQTIIGKMGVGGVPGPTRVPFNARVRVQSSGGSGYWVGEGKPKPLTKFDFTNVTMSITKVAGIAVLTEETLRLSSPSADALVRNALKGAIVERMDRDFIDPDFAGTATVSPASITYGAATAAASGTNNAAVLADLNTMVGSLLGTFPDASIGGFVLLMAARTAFALGQAQNSLGQSAFPSLTIQGGSLSGIPVITSEYLAYGGGLSPASNNLMILMHAPSIFLADDGEVRIDSSNEASLQMLDNPTNDVVTPTATSLVSMFQTDSVAIRAERVINWKVARAGAVYVTTNVAYTGAV